MKKLVLVTLALVALVFGMRSARAADPDVSGGWHFVLDTPGGDRELDATFKIDGQQVSGKWVEADVKGTYVDGKLVLEFPFTSPEAGEGVMKITGHMEGETLTGDWAFTEYSRTFKASRKPA